MSLIQLRDYQLQAVDAVMSAFKRGVRRPAVSLATGAGKTIILSQVIKESGQRSLVLAHRQEIIEQNRDKAKLILDDVNVGIVMAHRDDYDAKVISASIQTLANPERLKRVGEFGLIVADEAHHAVSPSWNYVLSKLGAGKDGDVRLLGVSATWDRTDGVGLDTVFDEIVYQLQIERLIALGYLSDIRAFRVDVDIDLSKVKRSKGGDYDQDELADAIMHEEQFPWAIADAIAEHGRDRHSLVFAPRVDTARLYRDAIRAQGMSCEIVHGETPRTEREDILHRFKSGEIQALTNCGVFLEGTDLPIVDLVCMGRPTTSRSLYQQSIGRGLRTYFDKADCIVIDMVGNSSKHELQTIASLFGEMAQGKSVKSALRSKESEPEELVTLAARSTVRINAKEVILKGFDRSKLLWRQVEDQTFSLSAGDIQYIVKPHERGSDHFDVVAFSREKGKQEIAANLDAGYSQGIVENIVLNSESAILAKKKASWRSRAKSEPATEKQVRMLAWLRIKHDPLISKADASNQIDIAMAQRNVRRM